MAAPSEPADRCRELVLGLRGSNARGAPAHAGGQGARIADHALTTSALVCCLAHGHPQRDLLRLAALTHESDTSSADAEREQVAPLAALLREHGALLDRGAAPDLGALDEPQRLLALAHIVASTRLPIRAASEFASHPLSGAPGVELVYGGATKIKDYVFESARLPEIRGASALLDHINRLDLPALWGVLPQLTRGAGPTEAQRRRYAEMRGWYEARYGAPLDAPECLLYASGGNVLALAPRGLGAVLASAIERRYTEETQVAQSVAVSEGASLLELQYGRAPSRFWADTFASAPEDVLQLIEGSYGTRDPHAIFGADSLGEGGGTAARKGFGELVTVLASQANRRRAGDGDGTGERRYPTLVELPSHARKCSSCDARPAVRHIEQPSAQDLCEACSRKRDAGSWAKKGSALVAGYDWLQPWGKWLAHRANVSVEGVANDLEDISPPSGAARGFVGLVYADGNNVGSYVAGLSSVDAYREFADHMLAVNEDAVAQALAAHVRPDGAGTWPFEIITIGGDDVLLFVTADSALELTIAIAQSFGDGMARSRITLSAGVLIMPEHTPVRFARDLVEQLLKRAKQRSKESAGGATIDFMALKSVTMIAETIEDYRRTAMARGQSLSLTQRPHTLDQLRTLIAACRALTIAQFPRSQLYQLRDLVEEGQQLRSMVDFRYFVDRGKLRRDSGLAYTRFERQVELLCDGTTDWLPWRVLEQMAPGAFDTPLLDLIEIMPFVARGRDGAQEAR